MADATTPAPERKVVRKDTFELTKNDKFLLEYLSEAVRLAQQQLQLANNNITNLLGIWSIERWGFGDNVDVRFSDFDLANGKITVEELEPTNDPKDQAAPAESTDAAGAAPESNDAQASAEAGSEAQGDGEEVPTV